MDQVTRTVYTVNQNHQVVATPITAVGDNLKKPNGWANKPKLMPALAKAFHQSHPNQNLVEVSSTNHGWGQNASAFNLSYRHNDKMYHVENVFQAGKHFKKSGYIEQALHGRGLDAKHAIRKFKSEGVDAFKLFDTPFPTEPDTYFYNYLYCKAMTQPQNKQLLNQVVQHDSFSDVNFERDIAGHRNNCQAQGCAIIKVLSDTNQLQSALQSPEAFKAAVYDSGMLVEAGHENEVTNTVAVQAKPKLAPKVPKAPSIQPIMPPVSLSQRNLKDDVTKFQKPGLNPIKPNTGQGPSKAKSQLTPQVHQATMRKPKPETVKPTASPATSKPKTKQTKPINKDDLSSLELSLVFVNQSESGYFSYNAKFRDTKTNQSSKYVYLAPLELKMLFEHVNRKFPSDMSIRYKASHHHPLLGAKDALPLLKSDVQPDFLPKNHFDQVSKPRRQAHPEFFRDFIDLDKPMSKPMREALKHLDTSRPVAPIPKNEFLNFLDLQNQKPVAAKPAAISPKFQHEPQNDQEMSTFVDELSAELAKVNPDTEHYANKTSKIEANSEPSLGDSIEAAIPNPKDEIKQIEKQANANDSQLKF